VVQAVVELEQWALRCTRCGILVPGSPFALMTQADLPEIPVSDGRLDESGLAVRGAEDR
jgi:hypothetical protein